MLAITASIARRKASSFGMPGCWRNSYIILVVSKAAAPGHDALLHFHNELVMQSGAYQNRTWVVGVAKAGNEEGVEQFGNSIIVAPSGEIVAA